MLSPCKYHALQGVFIVDTCKRIEVATRLRRAIVLNDLLLVKRIVRNNPKSLQNPDFDDKSNTSLHLAAKNGFVEIAVCVTGLHSET